MYDILWIGFYLCLGFSSIFAASPSYRLCLLAQTPSYFSAEAICDKLGSTPVRCVVAVDRLECMKKINSGEADFAVFEAEDILIAADDQHLSEILITHRIHATGQKKWEFGVVALVSNKANVSKLSELKGKRLCHPGNDPFSTNYDWSEVFSLYFENRVAPQDCLKELSVEENRIKALADFFGDSCKPGVWAADPVVDVSLKRKYTSMCSLCDVPSVCSQRDKYWGRQGALYCLSDCLGDVAWTMLRDAKLHFSSVDVSICSDVSLLCPDGSTMPLNSTDPCLWVTRPVPVIAAKRTKAEEIQVMLKQLLLMADTPDDFIRLLESNTLIPPLQLRPIITPTDYLATAPGFLSANSMTACGQGSRAVSLCVSTLQDKVKCEWLSAVSRVYGLESSLTCMYGANCFLSVANMSADVTIGSTDFLLRASRDHKLKPLLVQLPKKLKKARTVSAVVKSSSNITRMSDLQGRKACFPSVDGLGWNAFLKVMQKKGFLNGICPHIKAVSKFFAEICVSEPNPSLSSYVNVKLCTGDYSTETYGEEVTFDNEAVAFQCLAFGGGDVAFIASDSIPKYLEDMKINAEIEGLTVDSFKTVCEDDGSKNKDCTLNWASNSQVLVHGKISPSKEEDVVSLFSGLHSLFGHFNTPSTRTFNMFASSNSLFDIPAALEKDGVKQELVQIDSFLKKAKQRPDNYEANLKSLEVCIPSSANLYNSYPPILLTFISMVCFNVMTW